MLCDDLEGWDGGGGGWKAQEGIYIDIYIYTLMADSCCMAKTNTTL